jgi:hypothetical protein
MDILKQLEAGLRLEIEVAGAVPQLLAILKTHPSVQQVEAVNGMVRCRWSGGRETLPELHRRLVHDGIGLISLAVKTDNLEDIYMMVSGHRTS